MWYALCVYDGEFTMTKTLIQHGNSLALVIDKPILELLQISADTPLELTTNGDSLLVSPVREKARQKKLQASLEKINRKFGDDLKRLAEETVVIDFLSVHDVLTLHAELIATYGGEHGVRDLGLLESAVAQPQATFDDCCTQICSKWLQRILFTSCRTIRLLMATNEQTP
jgi:antitoxin MazE